MKKVILGSVAALILGAAQSQAVTLQLSVFGPNGQTILGNSAGAATNGMTWGLIVDKSGGDSIFGTTTEGVNFQYGASVNPNQTLTSGLIGGSDDYLFLSSNLTSNFGANGAATQIIFNLNADVIGGEKFAIIWFETGATGGVITQGTKYGIVTNDAFTIPVSNSANEGVVALRGSSPIGSTSYTWAVPEPSAVLLGLLGAVGLIRRRR